MSSTLKLKNEEDWFYKLIENSKDAIILLDRDIVIDCNTAAINLFEFSSKDILININPATLSPKYQPDNMLSAEKAEANGKLAYAKGSLRFEWLHKRANEELFTAEILFTRIDYKGKNLLHCVLREITNIKETQNALKTSQECFKILFEQASDGILIGNSDGIIVNANDSILKITGYQFNELIDKSISTLFREDVLKKNPLRFDLLKAGQTVLTERSLKKKDGSNIIIEMSSTKMTNNNLQTYIRDITERKANEQRIIDNNRELEITKNKLNKTNKELIEINNQLKYQQEELKLAKIKAEESDMLKSAFLANMSHEIRTPMNGILGFTDLLKTPNLTNRIQKQYLDIIDQSGKRMLNILNNLIDISKIESGQMDIFYESTNINELLEYQFNFFLLEAKSKNIELIRKVCCNNKTKIINTDKGKLNQVITNLIKNAIKFTNGGEIELGCSIDNNFLQFHIKDNGIGIEQSFTDTIFHRFKQADNGKSEINDGVGLGLSISKAFVEMLGGKIWVESEINKGSTFFFTIPNR